MKDRTVSVIIPVYKPDEKYVRLLKGLQKQTYPILEVIVINTERQYYHEENYPVLEQMRVFHISKDEFDHGRTRDEGAKKASGEILLFMTQDAVPADCHLIERLADAFSDETVGAAYARQLPDKNCRLIERYTRAFNYPKESRVKTRADLGQLGIKTYFCSNVCAAYKKSVYEELGGFERRTIFNEDMIFAAGLIQKGYSLAYCADARVIHSHNYSGPEQLHRNFDLAVSQADHPEIFQNVPSEKEGMRLVIDTARYLMYKHKPLEIVRLVYISLCKYAGYFLGKRYRSLPGWAVRRLSMNKRYWSSAGSADQGI